MADVHILCRMCTVEGGCRFWRHMKLTAEGNTFPLSVSENKFSTQPAAVRHVTFLICREAATKTLGGEAAVRPENPWAIGPSILRTFGAQRAPNYIDML